MTFASGAIMRATSDELQIFVTIVECGQLSLAAQLLGQNPSSVSRALARLEEKLGVTLLKRTTRSQDLTEEGVIYFDHAQRILQQMEEAEDLLFECSHTPAGRLRVDTASPFLLHCVLPYIPDFRRAYPNIELELTSSEGVIDLLEQRTDVALRLGPLSDSTLFSQLLGKSFRRVLASPEYLQRCGIPQVPEDLERHTILGFTKPERLNQWYLKSAKGDLWLVKPQLKASSGETLRQLAMRGEGIVYLSDFMTHEDRKEGRLIQILNDHTLPELQPIHAVYYKHTHLASRIRVFIDFLAQKLREPGGPLS